MKQHTWDLVIVGSGPAGSAAAVAALASAPGSSVLILDRSDYPCDKCRGDAVLDAAFAELDGDEISRVQLVAKHDSVDTFRIVSPRVRGFWAECSARSRSWPARSWTQICAPPREAGPYGDAIRYALYTSAYPCPNR